MSCNNRADCCCDKCMAEREDYTDEIKELAKQLFVKSLHSSTDVDSVGNKALYAIEHANRFMKTWNSWLLGDEEENDDIEDVETTEDTLCDKPGCTKEATSKGFIAGIRSNFCDEHASKYSLLRDPEEEDDE